ncbi:MAG: choice-of-anchor tandem repeat GloVer-containing protein [Candidatus Sulfotelmatobacter sp.]
MKTSKFRLTPGLAVVCAAFTFSLAVRAQAQTVTYPVVFNGTNGDQPSTVIQATDGNFYGTSTFGNTSENGNLFKMTPAGEISTLYNFCAKPHCSDGAWPETPPILGSDGNLYGVTSAGGSDLNNGAGWGTVYKITLDGQFTILHTFCTVDPCLDGQSPVGLIQAANGNLYGSAYGGGQFNAGTLFEITPAGVFSVVHAFCSLANCADGKWPQFAPVQGSDGNLYGTTSDGGSAGAGVLYDLTTSGRFNIVHTFLCRYTACPRGGEPIAVVQDSEGNLFGVTQFGGTAGEGTLFEITSTREYLNLYDFTYGNESFPRAGLTLASDGNFYGTTSGISGNGTIYQLTASGTHTTLYNFSCCTGGNVPYTGLFQAPNGNLYGAVLNFGQQTDGAIYSFSNNFGPLVETVPTLGPVGRSVLILGNNLTGSTSVTFNGVAAAFTVESDTYIIATVPKGATTGVVSVVTPSGTLNSNPQFVVTK